MRLLMDRFLSNGFSMWDQVSSTFYCRILKEGYSPPPQADINSSSSHFKDFNCGTVCSHIHFTLCNVGVWLKVRNSTPVQIGKFGGWGGERGGDKLLRKGHVARKTIHRRCRTPVILAICLSIFVFTRHLPIATRVLTIWRAVGSRERQSGRQPKNLERSA